MGLFEKAGRRFEKFKQAATEAADEEPDYECAACGTAIRTERDRCPECSAGEIVSRDDPEPEPTDPDGEPTDPDGGDDEATPRDAGEE